MKKIGLICLALVLALGGLGIGYASWVDTIYINGTVNTGTVDIEITELSGTWVWKIVDTHQTIYNHGWGVRSDSYPYGDPNAPAEAGSMLVASATAEFDPTDNTNDTIIVEFDNLFPSTTFWVDFLVHYNGTIPVMIDAEIVADAGSEWLEALWNNGHAGVTAYYYDPLNPHDTSNPIAAGDIQLHQSDVIKLILWIHLPQITGRPDSQFDQSYLSDLTGGFTATITATQWNE